MDKMTDIFQVKYIKWSCRFTWILLLAAGACEYFGYTRAVPWVLYLASTFVMQTTVKKESLPLKVVLGSLLLGVKMENEIVEPANSAADALRRDLQ